MERQEPPFPLDLTGSDGDNAFIPTGHGQQSRDFNRKLSAYGQPEYTTAIPSIEQDNSQCPNEVLGEDAENGVIFDPTSYGVTAQSFEDTPAHVDQVSVDIVSADGQEDCVDAPAALGTHTSTPASADSNGKRNAFKKTARLSQMLEYESSSSDEELYRVVPTNASLASRQQASMAQGDIGTVSAMNSTNALSKSDRTVADDTAQNSGEHESIPMCMLKGIVNPEVLSSVKAHLDKVSQQRNSLDASTVIEQSPANLWEQRKKEQNERMLSRTQAGIIKAGWRVRQCLSSLPEGENANTFYLTCVKRGMLREVEALFSVTKVDPRWGFNKNYKDEDEKSALSIAIDRKNTAMMSKLLEHDVNLGMSIFHVITMDFTEGLKLLLTYNPCTDHEITEENNYFQIGMTPMLLAAHKDNYKMLSLLHEYEHRLMKTVEWSEGIHEAWESANERRIICKARAQPAYITLMSEVNHMDPMKYCLKEIKKMRKYKEQEHEFSTFYNELIRQLEDYMCSLLDLICSSEELAHLFEYEHQVRPDLLSSLDTTTNRWVLWNRFKLLERASKEHLVQFVTHQQSQLALAHLRYRSMPFLRSQKIVLRNAFSTIVGLLFPILSLLYVIAPKSKLGCFIALPSISFSCHLVSDIVFSLLLLLNISLKNVDNYYLGAKPTTLEWLIFAWILGKWVQEFQECSHRGVKSYFRDNWNYNDIMMLTLFTISIVLRASDFLMNRSKAHLHIPRSEWDSYEPRLLAEGIKAWAYVFVFLRMLGIMRVDRNLGPLQISLAKMMADVLRFLCIFLLVICAFAFGLSELYWYYGTDDGALMLCRNETDSSSGQSSCTPQKNDVFSGMGRSFTNLFWALFGLLDINELSLSGKHVFTEYIGRSLVAVYHAVAIIVMLNMLIAMMSKSYEDTSTNEETEWKFHRTAMWIRFIRREVVRPPPMNLFPNPWRLKENFSRLKDFLQRICCRRKYSFEGAYDEYGHRRRRHFLTSDRKYSELTAEEERMASAPYDTFNRTGIELEEIRKHNCKDGAIEVEVHDKRTVSKELAEKQMALRVKFRAKKNKSVLDKLVRRYKLKYLVCRKVASTNNA